MFRPRLPPGVSAAFWIAVLLVGAVEAALHSELVLHRYRSVFALGRAYDKLHHVERHPPMVLFLGNSRTDNGIDPRTFSRAYLARDGYGFNLGIPGANAIIYHGILTRLDAQRLLGGKGVRTVVLGLDESALHDDDSLGYSAFLADRTTLWQEKRYLDWLGTYARLWSYADNLRQLSEPEKALRFAGATLHPTEPVGGSAARYLGYRAGFGGTQNAAQAAHQEAVARRAPDPRVEVFLWRAIALLQARGVRVVVTVPPLRDRISAFFDILPTAQPYRRVLAQLERRGVAVLPPPTVYPRGEFVNAGHLNDQGAQRYTQELARQLMAAGG